MKRFMAFYMAPISAIAQLAKAAPAQRQAGMEAWMAWAKKNEQSIVDMGAPLGKAMQMAASGAKNGSGKMTGFSILQGPSLRSMTKVFRKHPHLAIKGATIEVVEVMPLPGR
jgi:hypothetical protein